MGEDRLLNYSMPGEGPLPPFWQRAVAWALIWIAAVLILLVAALLVLQLVYSAALRI